MEKEYIEGAMQLIGNAQTRIHEAEKAIDNFKEIITDIRSEERFEALSISVRNSRRVIKDYHLCYAHLWPITGEDLLPLIEAKIEKLNKLIQDSYEEISNLIK